MLSDWSDLRTILAIARAGTLSGAARGLGLNQSTVSRRLQAIERDAGERLFVRGGDGGLEPTALGMRLVGAAEEMRTAFEAARAALSGAETPIRIATCEAIANAVLAPVLPRWAVEEGGRFDIAVHDDLFVLPDDDFDVLVTPLESAPPDMVGSRIARLDWGLYAGKAWLSRHPAPPPGESLAGSAVIAASGSLAEVEAYRWFAGLGGKPVASATSPLAMADLAAHGVGIALLPRLAAAGDRRLMELAFSGLPTSDVWMVARRAAAERRQVAAFLKWSRRNLKDRSRAES
jgi:DNA-binding transcriptional LysR family regulator